MAGLSIGIWAVISMRIGNMSVSPVVKENAELVQKGPYKLIRHPMYSAILICGIPIIINYFDWFRLAVLLVLFFNLLLKSKMEEMLLMRRFSEYKNYRRKTKRFFPFIF
jgi:protein-S-isoprenylcysteine O-methyltransferase Ste14